MGPMPVDKPHFCLRGTMQQGVDHFKIAMTTQVLSFQHYLLVSL
jgi:hypothetical protein